MAVAGESFGPLYQALSFPWYGEALGCDCQLRFIQVLLEVLHKGCAARSHGCGVAIVRLVLTVDITVGVADVDLAKLCEEIDAGAISSPEIGGAGFSVPHVAGEQRTAMIVSGLLQGL